MAQNFSVLILSAQKNLAHGSVHPVARQRALHRSLPRLPDSPTPAGRQASSRCPALPQSRTAAQVVTQTRERPSAAVSEREEEPSPPRSARRQRSHDPIRSRLPHRRSHRPLPSGFGPAIPSARPPSPRRRTAHGRVASTQAAPQRAAAAATAHGQHR